MASFLDAASEKLQIGRSIALREMKIGELGRVKPASYTWFWGLVLHT